MNISIAPAEKTGTPAAAAPYALLDPDRAAIPKALCAHRNRWAPWEAVWKPAKGKYDKVPRRATNPEYGVSSKQPWWNVDAAWEAYYQSCGVLAGVGWLCTVGDGLAAHGIVGIDLDHCIAADGSVAPWAQQIVESAGSYAERSPSGHGLRIFGFGEIAADWTNHEQGIEVYAGHDARFLTVTGLRLADVPDDVQQFPAGFLDGLAEQYRKKRDEVAKVLNPDIPDLLQASSLPSFEALPLSDTVRSFLAGESSGADRSRELAAATVALYQATMEADGTLRDDVVLSLLSQNAHAWSIALDHRRQDPDLALEYLWNHHCLKMRDYARSVADDFDIVPPVPGGRTALPNFERDNKGAILATIDNVRKALERPDVSSVMVRYDSFRDEIMLARTDSTEWRPFTDADYTRIRIHLETNKFKPVSKELVRDVILLIADENQFDSAIAWLDGLKWDGVHRIEHFLRDYFGTPDTQYTRAVSMYLWTALAARVAQPGCQVDMVPILVGAQGLRKSSAVASIAPLPDYFTEIDLSERDADQSRRMRGKLVGEIGELKGLHNRDLESVKSFITRRREEWTPKYKEFNTVFARRIVFIGTTNRDEFLADETGNRRWLPVRVSRADVDKLVADRDQLWAEAKQVFDDTGVQYQEAERLAIDVHDEHRMSDAWTPIVEEWLDLPDLITEETPRSREFLRAHEVLQGALSFDPKQIGRREEMRIGDVLRALNYEKVDKWVQGKTVKVWKPKK